MEDEGLRYILIRNINHELPSNLKLGKDIDILVDKSDLKNWARFFNHNEYRITPHPHAANIFLYGVDKFQMYANKANSVLFDLHFQLVVRSLDAGQWIPLDETIQRSAWENMRFYRDETGLMYWTLGFEDELVALIARSVFDKRRFEEGYTQRIGELFTLTDTFAMLERLEKVFFKFTPFLWCLLETKQYDEIVKKHLEFRGY
jgi:hypothetical protein